jgi:hypothetical protein
MSSRFCCELQHVRSSLIKLPFGRKKLRITLFLSSKTYPTFYLGVFTLSIGPYSVKTAKLVKKAFSSSVRETISEYSSSRVCEDRKDSHSITSSSASTGLSTPFSRASILKSSLMREQPIRFPSLSPSSSVLCLSSTFGSSQPPSARERDYSDFDCISRGETAFRRRG